MKEYVNEALNKWIEEHNAFDMSKGEAACRFMLEVIENTTFADEAYKERLLNVLKAYARITVGVDLNG